MKVPRPSAPPPDPSEVRGWRPSDPGETDEPVEAVVIPKPAPLPGAHRASQQRSEPPTATATPRVTPAQRTTDERASLDSTVEVSGLALAAVIVLGLVVFFALAFLFFL